MAKKQQDRDRIGEDNLALGAIQVMIGIFCLLMWYLLLLLYLKQIKAIFGTYEPITYKTACPLWGAIFIISGLFVIRTAYKSTACLIVFVFCLNLICVLTSIAALILTILELKNFQPVSYRNYGQAKIGREISRILVLFYCMEIFAAFISAVLCIFILISDDESASETSDIPSEP